MTDTLGIALGVDTSGLKKGTEELGRFSGAADKAGNAAKEFGDDINGATSSGKGLGGKVLPELNKQLPKTTRNLGMAKNGVQQLGFQVQDIAVSLQGGQSPFVVLGQQGSQIAGIFGPGGAVIGAMLAVGAAVTGTLVNSFFAGAEAAGEFQDVIDGVRDSLQSTRLEINAGAIELLRTQIQESSEEIKEMGRLQDAVNSGLVDLSTNPKLLERFNKQQDEINKKQKEQIKDGEALADLYRKQNEILMEGDNSTGKKSNGGIQTAVNQGFEAFTLDDFFREQEETAEKEIKLNDRKNNQKRRSDERLARDKQRMQDLELSTTENLFGNLADIAAAGGEESFLMYKRMAQAQAGVSAGLAILNALAAPTGNPILNGVMAVTIGALAGVQIAQIEQQQYTGARAMGGQVTGGSSYMVGEMGPEIITMGAQGGFVTPNHKLGGGESVTVVNQIGNGVSGNVRAEVASMLPSLTNSVMQAVRSSRR